MTIIKFKKADLRNVFGTLKTEMTGQEFKDLAREGWGDDSKLIESISKIKKKDLLKRLDNLKNYKSTK